MITREDILNDVAEFSWSFGMQFFVETYKHGNFIWNDPEYNGNNTFKQTRQTFKEYANGMLFRDKGIRHIKNYCGENIQIILLDGTRL